MKTFKFLLAFGMELLFVTAVFAILLNMSTSEKPESYDHKKSLIRVVGQFGHGSGVMFDTNKDETLILTNRHVCDGINADPVLAEKIKQNALLVFLNSLEGDKDAVDMGLYTAERLLAEQQRNINRPFFIEFKGIDKDDVFSTARIVSKYADLCIVSIDQGNMPVVRIANKNATMYEQIWTHSNPRMLVNTITTGYVGDSFDFEGKLYQHHSAPIWGGSSGSGSFNVSGELVGINTLSTSHTGLTAGSYMIPRDTVHLFIMDKRLKQEEIIVNPYIGGKL